MVTPNGMWRPMDKWPYRGSGCSYTRKRCEGISLVHLNVSRSQSEEARSGACGREQSHHTGAPDQESGELTSHLQGCWGSRKCSLEVYNTAGEAQHAYEVVRLRGPEVTPKKCPVLSKCVRYTLNQIPYDYTVEVRNRFKGLDLIDRVPDELGMRLMTLYRRQGSRPFPWKRNAKKQNGCLGKPYK